MLPPELFQNLYQSAWTGAIGAGVAGGTVTVARNTSESSKQATWQTACRNRGYGASRFWDYNQKMW